MWKAASATILGAWLLTATPLLAQPGSEENVPPADTEQPDAPGKPDAPEAQPAEPGAGQGSSAEPSGAERVERSPGPAAPAAPVAATPDLAPASSPPPPEPPAPEQVPESEPVEPVGAHHDHTRDHGIELPAGLRLNGRFDLLYEHGGYRDQPFQGGTDRLRNDHHFVFLSRSVKDDPFGIHVELVDLTFYEMSFHHRPAGEPWRMSVKMGKVLVPFGAEPLFHTTYGGRAGFDQELMPVVWARLGASVNFQYAVRPLGVRFSNDLYAVQGHRIGAADRVVNLQADFATLDDSRMGFGDRLGVAWGALSGWYSIYANDLGFERTLLMQAIDLEMWRPDVVVLDRFTLGVGAVRADVSGVGSGEDYYHLGTYFQLRYYPLDWLYLQYRQGIQSFGNRRSFLRDDTRLDGRDNSTHNVAIVGRHHGLSVGLYHFWNLEEAEEVDDDFLRLAVTLEF